MNMHRADFESVLSAQITSTAGANKQESSQDARCANIIIFPSIGLTTLLKQGTSGTCMELAE